MTHTEILVQPIDFLTHRGSRLEAMRIHALDEIERQPMVKSYISGRKVACNYKRTNEKVMGSLPLDVS